MSDLCPSPSNVFHIGSYGTPLSLCYNSQHMNDNQNTITNADTLGQPAPTSDDTAGHTPTDTQTSPAMAGHGAPQPAMAGHVAPEPPGHTAPLQGVADPVTTPVAVDTSGYVTLDEVAAAFEKAGIMRARRTFQRYCETGLLQAQKFDTLNGPQHFVLASSIPRAIESVKALEMSRTRPAQTTPDTAGQSQPQPVMSVSTPPPQPATPTPSTQLDPAMARYVERLEHDLDRAEAENDNKTAIINSLIERDRETNSLTQGLQKLLTPLLGRVYGQDFLGLDGRASAPDHK